MSLHIDDMEFHVPFTTNKDLQDVVWNSRLYEPRTYVVQADGDELEYIRRNFTGIPMSNARVVRWDGEVARFIVTNLF